MANMTLIQIRIVIDVPETDRDKFQGAIEKILETVRAQFPDLKTNQMYSPVTVTIKDMQADG